MTARERILRFCRYVVMLAGESTTVHSSSDLETARSFIEKCVSDINAGKPTEERLQNIEKLLGLRA